MKRRRYRRVKMCSGYRGELMRLMLTNGIVPYDALHMLKGEHRLYTRKLKEMEEEGIVEIVRYKNKKVATLKGFEMNYEKYISSFPVGYYGYYNRIGSQIKIKLGRRADKVQAERAYREGKVSTLMYGCGINELFEEKPDITTDESDIITSACYYGMGEIKLGFGDGEKAIFNSRAIGCIVGQGGMFAVYDTESRAMKWNDASEDRMMIYTARIINKAFPQHENKVQPLTESLVLAYNEKTLCKVILNEKEDKLINTETKYVSMYGMLYKKEYMPLIKNLCSDSEWKTRMKKRYLEADGFNISPGIINMLPVSCDGVNENGEYVLLFCIPDISKLRRFLSAAHMSKQPERYKLYCYSFQAPIVATLTNNAIEVYTTEYEDV